MSFPFQQTSVAILGDESLLSSINLAKMVMQPSNVILRNNLIIEVFYVQRYGPIAYVTIAIPSLCRALPSVLGRVDVSVQRWREDKGGRKAEGRRKVTPCTGDMYVVYALIII